MHRLGVSKGGAGGVYIQAARALSAGRCVCVVCSAGGSGLSWAFRRGSSAGRSSEGRGGTMMYDARGRWKSRNAAAAESGSGSGASTRAGQYTLAGMRCTFEIAGVEGRRACFIKRVHGGQESESEAKCLLAGGHRAIRRARRGMRGAVTARVVSHRGLERRDSSDGSLPPGRGKRRWTCMHQSRASHCLVQSCGDGGTGGLGGGGSLFRARQVNASPSPRSPGRDRMQEGCPVAMHSVRIAAMTRRDADTDTDAHTHTTRHDTTRHDTTPHLLRSPSVCLLSFWTIAVASKKHCERPFPLLPHDSGAAHARFRDASSGGSCSIGLAPPGDHFGDPGSARHSGRGSARRLCFPLWTLKRRRPGLCQPLLRPTPVGLCWAQIAHLQYPQTRSSPARPRPAARSSARRHLAVAVFACLRGPSAIRQHRRRTCSKRNTSQPFWRALDGLGILPARFLASTRALAGSPATHTALLSGVH